LADEFPNFQGLRLDVGSVVCGFEFRIHFERYWPDDSNKSDDFANQLKQYDIENAIEEESSGCDV